MFNKKSLLTILVVITLVFFSTMAIAQDLGFTVSGDAGINLLVGISMADDVEKSGSVTANLDQWAGAGIGGSASGTAGDDTVEWSAGFDSGDCIADAWNGGINWNFAENMAFKFDGSFTYEMVVPDTLTLGVNIDGGNGIVYESVATGFRYDADDDVQDIRLGVDITNIAAGPATLNAGFGYKMFINNNVDGWQFSGTDDDGDPTNWVAAGYDKTGVLDFYAGATIAMDDLMSVTVGLDNFELWLALGKTVVDTSLSFSLLAVPDLSLSLDAGLYMEMQADKKAEDLDYNNLLGLADDAEVFKDVDNIMNIPIELSVGYTLDLGFGTLNPYAAGGADIGGQDRNSSPIERPWYVKAGADMNLAGGAVTIPLGVIVTNNTTNPGTLSNGDGDPLAQVDDRFTKIYITTGLNVSF